MPNHLQSRIHEIRSQKVMLDFDLAQLYDIETKVLNQAVKRNSKRFPPDFMFRLTAEEWNVMRSQFVTASQNKRNTDITPFAFTEQGIAMLSGILKSDVAIHVNIAIMRTFVMIRKFALQHDDFNQKLLEIENRYDKQFHDIYEALNFLIERDSKTPSERTQIGYK